MAMSVKMRQVHERAAAYNARLRADDLRMRRSVHLVHGDGTTYFFRNAFLMEVRDFSYEVLVGEDESSRDYWVVVFTEHHGFHVFYRDDVEGLSELEEFYGTREELKSGDQDLPPRPERGGGDEGEVSLGSDASVLPESPGQT